MITIKASRPSVRATRISKKSALMRVISSTSRRGWIPLDSGIGTLERDQNASKF